LEKLHNNCLYEADAEAFFYQYQFFEEGKVALEQANKKIKGSSI